MRQQPRGKAATERQRHPDQLAELEAADRLQLGDLAEKVRVTEACAQQWRTQGLDRASNGETPQGIADLLGKPVSWFCRP